MSADAAEATGTERARGGLRSALTDRNFVPYLVGNVLSNCGTWFQNIAQTLLVWRLTGSVFIVGLVNLAQFAGVLVVGPWAGVVADRLDRRRLLLWTQVFSGSITATLAIVAAVGRATVPMVVVVALLLGLAQAFSVPAMLALVPQLVRTEHLAAAVSLNIVTFNIARAVGPVIGALVVATLGISAAFAVNALSFAALAAALMVVRPLVPQPRRAAERPRLRETIQEVRRRSDLRRVFVAAGCASIAIDPVTTLTPKYATAVFGGSDTLVGWFVGAFGAGAVLAGLWVAQRRPPTDRELGGRVMLLSTSLVVFAVVPSLLLALAALVSAGFWFICLSAAGLARVQRSTDAASHGRLMALWSIAFMGTRPVAALVDGSIASIVDVRWATVLIVAPAAIVGVTLLADVRWRRPRFVRGQPTAIS